METFSLSALVVFLAEIGDKTQLLSLMLALRFRAPWLISLAILLATLLNHAVAVWFGSWVVAWISPDILQYLIAASFFAVAVWTLIPDKLSDNDGATTGYGVFLTTLALFFVAEMGDKTQVATVLLAAECSATIMVIAGTTLGMLLANIPVVFFGENLAKRLPLQWIRRGAALLFAGLGVMALVNPS
ncbi:TMEM165/GDT1 family protein [Thalassotalea sp. G20_0]|uniref:TMEM165/GDT1 family protein n=1 Tax=Thalassotalea sp. G20_0 TaxID=2821093 RepID=UPI001ADD2CE8|nr:TMEM165/GDT1 family protein [Thalassotalea sp. G20_0]MBO9492546.1 TMEM165/GDT1 family protein [Thalassotalea sp. G20_0]